MLEVLTIEEINQRFFTPVLRGQDVPSDLPRSETEPGK
jgi:hypothetical protein